MPHRQVRASTREQRILEDHDAPDEVDAALVRAARDVARVVVVARGPRRAGERHRSGYEADLAVLVLDVEFQRREAAALEIQVLVELAGQRRQRRREVNAADLDR